MSALFVYFFNALTLDKLLADVIDEFYLIDYI